jgi:hypothetical protein
MLPSFPIVLEQRPWQWSCLDSTIEATLASMVPTAFLIMMCSTRGQKGVVITGLDRFKIIWLKIVLNNTEYPKRMYSKGTCSAHISEYAGAQATTRIHVLLWILTMVIIG